MGRRSGSVMFRLFLAGIFVYLLICISLMIYLSVAPNTGVESMSPTTKYKHMDELNPLTRVGVASDKLSRSLNSVEKNPANSLLHSLEPGLPNGSSPSPPEASLLPSEPSVEDLATEKAGPIATESVPAPAVKAASEVKEVKEVKEVPVNSTYCEGPFPGYPDCANKVEWMSHFWTSDNCYKLKGVDGSKCSFVQYLSEIEHYCPWLPWRTEFRKKSEPQITAVRDDLSPLLDQLSKSPKFSWIQQRIVKFWPKWLAAAKEMEREAPFFHTEKTILMYIGALSDRSGFHFAENAFKGGPLGEMVQWSDLILALYVTGYNIEFGTELSHLQEIIQVTKGIGGCPTASEIKFDTIFIDITGLKQFRSVSKGRFQHYKCLFRVLDSFGTEPTFNFKAWKPPDKHKDHGQAWGNWDLNPRQFMTMFPHSPDNSFLGFAIDVDQPEGEVLQKENRALVYGKEAYMWRGREPYLDVISKHLDLHATVNVEAGDTANRIPSYVINHGILNATELIKILKKTKIFVGLGFPYEGPAPLEALAYGCVFLNPRVDPPMHRENTPFFAKKPTDRALSSQHPYTQTHIGPPLVRTLDIGDLEAVDREVADILSKPSPSPYLPFEFSMRGMLERLVVYLENQDFCHPKQWPPLSEMNVVVSDPGRDCKDTCYSKGFVCEPEFFSALNTQEAIEKATSRPCLEVTVEPSVHSPSQSSGSGGRCSLQKLPLLFGCVGARPDQQRVCPCRGYVRGQVSLCSSCQRG